jgi:hypothetical protein
VKPDLGIQNEFFLFYYFTQIIDNPPGFYGTAVWPTNPQNSILAIWMRIFRFIKLPIKMKTVSKNVSQEFCCWII